MTGEPIDEKVLESMLMGLAGESWRISFNTLVKLKAISSSLSIKLKDNIIDYENKKVAENARKVIEIVNK